MIENFSSKMNKQMLREIRANSKQELENEFTSMWGRITGRRNIIKKNTKMLDISDTGLYNNLACMKLHVVE